MNGSLSEGVLPGLLRDFYVGRRTGLLHFVDGDERRGVRFRKGHIVRADSNVKEERLGETLVRLGRLSQVDLDQASQMVIHDKKRLGLVLQELGVMDKEQVEEALALHAREVLQKAFSASEGSYSFEDQDPEAQLDEDVTLRLSTGEIILEAVRRVEDPDVIRYALGDIDRVLGLSTDPLLRFQRITLTPADGYILSRIDGTLSAREITQMIPMVPEETQRSLFGLLCTGIVEYLPLPPKPALKAARAAGPVGRPATPASAKAAPGPATAAPPPAPRREPLPQPPPAAAAPAPVESEAATARRQEILEAYEGLKSRNHFEVLGIPKASSEAQVKDAYFRLAKRFHPDAHHDPTLADLKDKLEAVFIRLGQAYETLRNPRSRSSYESDLAARAPRVPTAPQAGAAPEAPAAPDPAHEARMADEAIRKAEKLFGNEKYWDAIQLLEPAIQWAQARQKSKARVLLAKCYLKNPKWVKRAEEMLQTVVQDDPRYADAYFVLGTIYKGSRLKSRALAMFRKVLEIKPDHEQANTEVVLLAPEEPDSAPEGGGLLKKLFGKN